MVVQYRSEASNALPTSGAHPIATTYIEDTYVDDGDEGTNFNSNALLKIEDSGGVTASPGGNRINALLKLVLPDRPDPSFGDISKIVLKLVNYQGGDGANTTDVSVDAHLMTHTSHTTSGATWANYDGSSAWGATGGDYDSSSDWGFGSGGVIAAHRPGDTTPQSSTFSLDLSAICMGDARGKGKYNWGLTAPILLRFDSTYDGSGTELKNGEQSYYSTATTAGASLKPWIEIWFNNPPPDAPFISVIPDTNGIEPKVKVDKHSTTPNLLRYSLGWDNVATNIEHGGVGVSMTDSDAVGLGSQPTLWPASKMTSTTLLDTEDTAYSVFIVAEHTHNQDLEGSKSNQVTIARPKVDTSSGTGTHSGVLGTGSSTVAATKTVVVGEEVNIRIKSTSSVHSGKIKRFWINWEANISDTAEDYGQFDVDEHVDGDTTVSNKIFKHFYDRKEASNFTIKVQVEDEVGFRSNSTLIATITITTPRPIAKLTKSRATIIEADKADINNTVVVSGQHSYAQGSNRYIKGYKYKHNGGGGNAPLTAFPTANDNSVIYNEGSSERLAMTCSLDNCHGNTFRVYGIYSVADDGSDVVDTAVTFSHYVWGYEQIIPGAAKVVGFGNGSSFFKHVSYVVCNAGTIDAEDLGAFYSLVLRDDNTKIINNHLAVEKDNYKWGGYYGPLVASCTISGSNNYDQSSGSNYFASVMGLRAGDKVLVSGSAVAGVNGIKTVVTATEDDLTIAESLSDNLSSESLTFERITDHIVSVPIAAYAAQTNIVTHDIVDDNAQTAATASTQTIQVLSDNQLTYPLTTDIDAGHIAILNTKLSRSGGLTPVMATGDARYPLGLTRTKLGLPTLTMNVRIMSNEGLRNMWSLVEGDRFAWVTLKKHLIDAPDPLVPYRTLRLKPTSASLSKTPTDNKDYTASLTFVVMGEDI